MLAESFAMLNIFPGLKLPFTLTSSPSLRISADFSSGVTSILFNISSECSENSSLICFGFILHTPPPNTAPNSPINSICCLHQSWRNSISHSLSSPWLWSKIEAQLEPCVGSGISHVFNSGLSTALLNCDKYSSLVMLHPT